MSRVDEVLRLYRQGWTPSRVARDLRMPRDQVFAILEQRNRWWRVDGDRPLGDQVMAALEDGSVGLDVGESGDVIELVLEVADELGAQPIGRQECFSLEHVVNGLLAGESRDGVLVKIHLRSLLRRVRPDESTWPEWLRRKAVAA